MRKGDTHADHMKVLGEKLRRLGFSSYPEFLRSERWATKRRAYFRKYPNALCAVCGARATQLHHRTYKRLGQEKNSDLHALCGSCHKDVHDFARKDARFGAAVERWRRSRDRSLAKL